MICTADDRERIFTRRALIGPMRFPRIVFAVHSLKAASRLNDGEGVVYNKYGMPSFDLLHSA
jgi:hypothetical protein